MLEGIGKRVWGCRKASRHVRACVMAVPSVPVWNLAVSLTRDGILIGSVHPDSQITQPDCWAGLGPHDSARRESVWARGKAYSPLRGSCPEEDLRPVPVMGVGGGGRRSTGFSMLSSNHPARLPHVPIQSLCFSILKKKKKCYAKAS